MSHTVVFTPEAEAQLVELYSYIAAEASSEIAARFTDGIVAYCESLSTSPIVGTSAKISVLACVSRTIAGESPLPSMWTKTRSTSSVSSTAAKTTYRLCSEKNEMSTSSSEKLIPQTLAFMSGPKWNIKLHRLMKFGDGLKSGTVEWERRLDRSSRMSGRNARSGYRVARTDMRLNVP